MKRKIIALISVLAFSFSVIAFSVSAVEGDGESGTEIIETEPASEPEPTYEPEPEPTYEPEPEPTYEPEPEPTYYPEPEPTEDYYEPTYNYSEVDDKPYYSDGDEVYVGGGQTTYTVPETTAPPAQMYSVSKDDIDDKTLSASDWNDISANLKNASLTDSDGDDFSFIKKNTSKSDNGNWMLYAGIVCIALSFAGIVFFIVSTVKSRSRYNFAPASGKATRLEKAIRSRFDTADVELPKHNASKGGTRFKH